MNEKSLYELEKEFGTNITQGLINTCIVDNQKKYGKNELLTKKRKGLFSKILDQLKDILILILIASAILSFAVDSSQWIESLIIIFVVFLNTILGVIQESKAENALESLMNLSPLNSTVLRDKKKLQIPSTNVVVGDVVYIEAGDYIPADGKIIEAFDLTVDESALTGESIPIEKHKDEHSSFGYVYSSTFVTKGHAAYLVCEVGMNTEIGKIASMLHNHKESLTPLQQKLESVGKWIGFLAIGICILVFFLEWLSGMMALEAFKTSIALAVAAIPEGLASVVTIVLALGVERMVKKNAIIKKLPAVETLGSCNVICSDKTGTLTQNKMEIKRMYTITGEVKFDQLNYSEKDVLSYLAACCNVDITSEKKSKDATELAIIDCKLKYAKDYDIPSREAEIPFDSNRKLMTVICRKNNKYIQITKGAFDVLINKCHYNFFSAQADKIFQDMSKDALRVLGVAIKEYDEMPVQIDSSLEVGMSLLGIIGMIDPPRIEVAESIQIAQSAGIKVVMITGDYITNASAIAKELNILQPTDLAITSSDLKKLSDEEFIQSIDKYSVYARATPTDKARIISAWQSRGMVVAMTGDGVNDAPALKKADIGCAMGISGIDVSKQAADMILADDNFTTIVHAVKEGRCVYDNIKKCIQYLLSSNIGEVITILMASVLSIFGFRRIGVPLRPIHLLWINVITDTLPAFGLGMDKPNDEIMLEKPKKKNESFFSHKLWLKILLEGIIIGILTLISYMIGALVYQSEGLGQTMAFVTLSTCQLFHSYNVKTNHSIFNKKIFENKVLNLSFIIGFVLQIFIIYTPYVHTIFNFEILSIPNLVLCIGLAFMIVLWTELEKKIIKTK